MKEKILYVLWACLYALCVGLGFVSSPQGFGKVLLVLIALVFFVPGFWLLYLGGGDRKKRLRLRIIAAASLGLTLSLLIANMLSVAVSESVGQLLHELLALVSAPMLCAQYWVLSLFLWACLLFGTFIKLPKKEC